MPALIGLYSPAARSGKTTVSRALELRGYTAVPFAEPIKLMLQPLLKELQYPSKEIARLLYHDKEEVLPALGVSSRHLMQTLGTEWGRQSVASDMWLRVWKARIAWHDRVVVDDLRFENEAELVRSMGGEVWKVVRTGVSNTSTHASEGSLDAWPHFSRVIANNGTLDDLHNTIAALSLHALTP